MTEHVCSDPEGYKAAYQCGAIDATFTMIFGVGVIASIIGVLMLVGWL